MWAQDVNYSLKSKACSLDLRNVEKKTPQTFIMWPASAEMLLIWQF